MNNYELMILSNRLVPNPNNYPIDEDFVRYCDKQIEALNTLKDSIDKVVKIIVFQSIDCNDKATYATKNKVNTKYEYINESIFRLINEKVKHFKEGVKLSLELKNF